MSVIWDYGWLRHTGANPGSCLPRAHPCAIVNEEPLLESTMLERRITFATAVGLIVACLSGGRSLLSAAEPDAFAPTWESLRAHYQAPDWYRDAKFGIFMHWGPCSVPAPANDGWYGRNMYLQEGAPWGSAYAFHVKTYGHPSQVGYKDIIPLWKAEKWDPEELVGFFKRIGARYVVPVAVHHDNFDCYASTFQPWNSVTMGPKRDIIGDWRAAILRAGLRFGVSSHSDRAWGWWETAHGSDTTGPLKGVSYDGNATKADGVGRWWSGLDPADLYCPRLVPGGWGKQDPRTSEAYAATWSARTRELIDRYQPDLLYFDGGLPMGQRGLDIAAHLYNAKVRAGASPAGPWATDAVLNVKWNPPLEAIVDDQEKGLADWVRPRPWQVDASINAMWFADRLPLELTSRGIIATLVDTVSKDGNLLLNIALEADGTLPDEQRRRLERVGAWLERNGAAIYGTRATHLYGEGPTRVRHWQNVGSDLPAFTPADMRFTTRNGVLYAIALGWPASNTFNIQALRTSAGIFAGAVDTVSLLGSAGTLRWTQTASGLTVTLPPGQRDAVDGDGIALAITGLKDVQRDGVVRPLADGTIRLPGWDAKLDGSSIRVLSSSGCVGDWDKEGEFPHWDFVCPEAGTYDLTARASSDGDGGQAEVRIVGAGFRKTVPWAIARTSGLDDFRTVALGQVSFDRAGRFSVSVVPVPGAWKSVRLAWLQCKSPLVRAGADSSWVLASDDAVLHGKGFFLQTTKGVTNLGGWNDAQEWVSWDPLYVPAPGDFEVAVLVAAGDAEQVDISIGAQTVRGALPRSEDFGLVTIGRIHIAQPGAYPLTLRPVPSGWKWMNFSQVVVRPVP